MCYDIDLVALMLQQAEMQARGQGGLDISDLERLTKQAPVGFAMEARIYAEVPSRNFEPSPGLLQNVEWYVAEGVRVDTWVVSGTNISPFYDPMIAKVMVWSGQSRDGAIEKMRLALSKSLVQGCPTNVKYLEAIVNSPRFQAGDTTTSFLSAENFTFKPMTIDVIQGGTYTTIQDWPARRGVAHGVPESGPMDTVSFRLANVIVGNPETMEGLEITLIGPELLFNAPGIIAVTGATINVKIDGKAVDTYTRLHVRAGQRLTFGDVTSGCRAYVAIKGGFPGIPHYLGSKSTTTTLGLGGYQGRRLLPNDTLDLDPDCVQWAADFVPLSVPDDVRLDKLWTSDWTLYVMPGPHDDLEFVTEEGKSSHLTARGLFSPADFYTRPVQIEKSCTVPVGRSLTTRRETVIACGDLD